MPFPTEGSNPSVVLSKRTTKVALPTDYLVGDEEITSRSHLQNNQPNNEPMLPPCPFADPVGGSIVFHLEEWRSITKDKWVLNIVKNGFLLRFKSPPPPVPPQRKCHQKSCVTRSEHSSKKKGHRMCSPTPRSPHTHQQKRGIILDISWSKKSSQGVQTDSRSALFKQVHPKREISNVGPAPDLSSSPPRRLDVCHRPTGHLLPHSGVH